MGPLKRLYDEGKVGGYPGRWLPQPQPLPLPLHGHLAHLRARQAQGTEGWLGRTIREIDPNKDNVLTGVNFGRGLPRALAAPGVPVASVGNLATYGVLTGIDGEDQRADALDVFSRIYSPTVGRNMVDRLSVPDRHGRSQGRRHPFSTAPESYSSTVEYGGDVVGQYMRNIAQVHLADFGTRILYTTAPYNSFDTHAGELMAAHANLWTNTSNAIADFYDDLKAERRLPTTSCCWSSPSSAAASRTTAPAPTTVPVASPSSSVTPSRAASMASTPPSRKSHLLEGDLLITTTTSAAPTLPSWRTGWGWTPQPICQRHLRKVRLRLNRRHNLPSLSSPERDGPPSRPWLRGVTLHQ